MCFLYLILPHTGYIGEFEIVDDHRAGKIVVNLTGRLIKCGVISPRFDVKINAIEKWTTNLLPSRQFGCVSWVFCKVSVCCVTKCHHKCRQKFTSPPHVSVCYFASNFWNWNGLNFILFFIYFLSFYFSQSVFHIFTIWLAFFMPKCHHYHPFYFSFLVSMMRLAVSMRIVHFVNIWLLLLLFLYFFSSNCFIKAICWMYIGFSVKGLGRLTKLKFCWWIGTLLFPISVNIFKGNSGAQVSPLIGQQLWGSVFEVHSALMNLPNLPLPFLSPPPVSLCSPPQAESWTTRRRRGNIWEGRFLDSSSK